MGVLFVRVTYFLAFLMKKPKLCYVFPPFGAFFVLMGEINGDSLVNFERIWLCIACCAWWFLRLWIVSCLCCPVHLIVKYLVVVLNLFPSPFKHKLGRTAWHIIGEPCKHGHRLRSASWVMLCLHWTLLFFFSFLVVLQFWFLMRLTNYQEKPSTPSEGQWRNIVHHAVWSCAAIVLQRLLKQFALAASMSE